MTSPILPSATLRLSIDTHALASNWRTLDEMSGEGAVAGAAVKAGCYGLGIEACVPALRDAGAEAFFVAHWSEVAAVSAHVPAPQIAVLHGPITQADSDYARAVGCLPVINSLAQAKLWAETGGGLCHLMIDTGINRLGIAPAEVGDPVIQALEIDTVMSHLACADEDSEMNERQLAAFKDCLPELEYKRASLANSAGIALGSDYAFDMTRPGLALYGGVPRDEFAGKIKQVAHVEAAIIQTRDISAGDAVGYNGEFVASKDMKVGTVSLGYADGFLRARGKGAAFAIGDTALPLLGKVSMDMVVVDLSNADDLREGDWLSVPFDLPHAAQQSSVSQYELLTVLGQRMRG